jgi:hypothetical protein
VTPRLAIAEDIPALVKIGTKFHAMSPHKWMGEFDGAAIGRMLAFLIDNPAGLVVTNGEGVIGGMMSPVYFNPSKENGNGYSTHGAGHPACEFQCNGEFLRRHDGCGQRGYRQDQHQNC